MVQALTLSSHYAVLAIRAGSQLMSAQAPGLSGSYSARALRSQSSPFSGQQGPTDYLRVAQSPTLPAIPTARGVLAHGQLLLRQDVQELAVLVARAARGAGARAPRVHLHRNAAAGGEMHVHIRPDALDLFWPRNDVTARALT